MLIAAAAFMWLFVSGCSQADDKITIFFFSELTPELENEVLSLVPDSVENKENVQLEFYPFYHEKLIVELAGKNGDVFFVPQGELTNLIDPVAFAELTETADQSHFSTDAVERFKREDPATGERNVYALPVEDQSLLGEKLNGQLQEPLAVFIPDYAENKKESLEILSHLLQ